MDADTLIREGRQERRPIQAPNTGTPEEITAQYLADTPPGRRGINLGCGGMTFRYWLNIDVDQPHHADIIWDMKGGLPFLPDGQFDAVYSEAFLEHIEPDAAMVLLKDCLRGLRPGGRIRITIPDLMDLWRIYVTKEKHPEADEAIRKYTGGGRLFGTPCELFNYAMHGEGHKYMYDHEEIERLFTACGFVDITFPAFGQSDFPLLQHRENRSLTLITEGRKPG
jgi:predicted SAM-dependent methyltransferase